MNPVDNGPVIDSVSVLAMPWVFSQSHPLTTTDVVSEAKIRGVAVDPQSLRELYKRGDLRPIAEITARRARGAAEVFDVPRARGSMQAQLQRALADGRVRDTQAEAFRPRLRFDSRKLSDPLRWMNGLIYSKWQLLAAPELRQRLLSRRVSGPYERRVMLPPLDEHARRQAKRLESWAMVLAALEARYFPTVNPESCTGRTRKSTSGARSAQHSTR